MATKQETPAERRQREADEKRARDLRRSEARAHNGKWSRG